MEQRHDLGMAIHLGLPLYLNSAYYGSEVNERMKIIRICTFRYNKLKLLIFIKRRSEFSLI